MATLMLPTGCSKSQSSHSNTEATVTEMEAEAKTTTVITEELSEEYTTELTEVVTTESITEEMQSSEEVEADTRLEDMYIGTYNDENGDPGLVVELAEDGFYCIDISIVRLTALEDGVGTWTDKGLEFVVTDASGNPIEGIITLEGQEAVVTFTNSTWEYIANGDSYHYVRAE